MLKPVKELSDSVFVFLFVGLV